MYGKIKLRIMLEESPPQRGEALLASISRSGPWAGRGKMKKVLKIVLVLMLSVTPVFAADPFDFFTSNLTGLENIVQNNLDNFAKDLGGVLGGGAFHDGKALGLPGFDVGIHVPTKSVNNDNVIVKDADLEMLLVPIVQAEIGLPAKLNFIGRYTSFAGASMIGFGLRYGFLKGKLPGMPCLSAQLVYNTLNVTAAGNEFNANTISIAGVASFNLPVINPYIGLGIDMTTVEPDSQIPLPKSGMKGTATGTRLEAGVNISMVPLTYLQIGGGYINGETGYTLGLGIKF